MKVFFTDKLVLLLVLAPIPFWVITAGVDSGTQSPVINQILILAILYPMLEETVFRGIIQPTIYNRLNGRLGLFSYANILTSILFSLAHLPSHEPIWALAVFIPSLAFGLLKDKYKTLLAPVALHSYYNTGYFLIAGWQF